MDGPVGKEPVARGPEIGAVLHVVGCNAMTQIDDGGLRIDRENHALHAGHEPIPIPKIGQECDDRDGMRHETALTISNLKSQISNLKIPTANLIFQWAQGAAVWPRTPQTLFRPLHTPRS